MRLMKVASLILGIASFVAGGGQAAGLVERASWLTRQNHDRVVLGVYNR